MRKWLDVVNDLGELKAVAGRVKMLALNRTKLG